MSRHRNRPDTALVIAYAAAIGVLVSSATLTTLGLSDLIFWEHGGKVASAAWAAWAVSLAVIYGTVSHSANQRERGDR